MENIIKRLNNDTNYEANRELAQNIVQNNPKAVHYYLTVIGVPIIKHIENTIMHRDIMAEYYIFFAKA